MDEDRLAEALALVIELIRRHDSRLDQHAERLDQQQLQWAQHQTRMQFLEGLMAQQVTIQADVRATLARVETLLARIIPHGENGREA